MLGLVAVVGQSELQAQDKQPDPNATAAGNGGDGLAPLGFGIGIGNTWLSRENVREAVVTDGIVRVTESEREQRAFWLETHYLFDSWPKNWNYVSHGPMVAAQFNGDRGIFSALAFGYMLSFKRTRKSDRTSNAAFNVGLAYAGTRIQQFGNGLTEDEALPAGEMAVRYRSRDTGGVLLLISFNFRSVVGTDRTPE